MFSLFRNSKIHPSLNKYAVLFSFICVIYWLYFAFIEKSLLNKLFEGHAMIVDLVFGLPLVLAMAVMIYALVYWSIKLLVMFLMPQAIVQISSDETDQEIEQNLQEMEAEHGEAYWNKKDDEQNKS